ncbi:MAG: phosphoglucosamine mutase [Acidobacteria bacterium]|nr:phosphoglucosamine mutase [Acidobacteriota bacterium]MCZ6876652.1 phosphoglucosamine mutase [Acidobacteriota bacterium]
MCELFGTDGIRGVAGEYPLDFPTVYKLGKAVVRSGKRSILIGRDTRTSGLWIEKALQQAILSEGGEVTLADVITTPGVAILSRNIPFDTGIVVSASHNPYQDNGIKMFSRNGIKLSDEEERWIEQAVAGDANLDPGAKISEDRNQDEIIALNQGLVERYIDFLRAASSVPTLKPLKVVLDCAHGAAFHIAPQLFKKLGAEVVAINTQPNGRNINHNCGAVYPQQMAQTVLEAQASFGVAFDGDGDRAIFSDEKGNLLDGDYTLFILARSLQKKGQLESGCVVITVMANKGLEVALQREHIRTLRTRVGDRFVLAEMLRGNHSLGGEQSGHVIMKAGFFVGDGILSALKIGNLVLEEGCSLGDLARGLEKFPQVLINVRVREKPDFSKIAEIQRDIEAAQESLGEKGRVVIRYSGTEPLVRVMLEGESAGEINKYAEGIAARFHEHLGETS